MYLYINAKTKYCCQNKESNTFIRNKTTPLLPSHNFM